MNVETYSHDLVVRGQQGHIQDLKIVPWGEDLFQVLFRRGGHTEVVDTLSQEDASQLIARFKFIGGMDVGERRKSQVGSITYQSAGCHQRLRLSAVGDYQQNESLVLRFLHPLSAGELNFFIPKQMEIIREMTKGAELFLFSGPTGSGKTTLMYHLAKASGGEVITIEDPVEIIEESFLQLQINPKIGQDYDELIKLSLRHRPDVLIIGEIRDGKTARAAIRAALTGHKVFATVHARGVTETKDRIYDLVGEDSELNNCLGGIIYQRLLLDTKQELRGLMAYQFAQTCPYQSWSHNMAQIVAEGSYGGQL